MDTWFPMVPERTNRPASFPVMSATKDSSSLVVLSSSNTSSSNVVDWMAASILAVGVVTTSERKSNSAGPGDAHAFSP